MTAIVAFAKLFDECRTLQTKKIVAEQFEALYVRVDVHNFPDVYFCIKDLSQLIGDSDYKKYTCASLRKHTTKSLHVISYQDSHTYLLAKSVKYKEYIQKKLDFDFQKEYATKLAKIKIMPNEYAHKAAKICVDTDVSMRELSNMALWQLVSFINYKTPLHIYAPILQRHKKIYHNHFKSKEWTKEQIDNMSQIARLEIKEREQLMAKEK